MDSDRLLCWGSNPGVSGGRRYLTGPGQVAYNTNDPVIDVALDGYSSCYITQYGNLHCWGGGPGSGSTPSNITLPSSRSAIDMTISDEHMCVLLDNNSIACRGANQNGELGDGTTTSRSSWVYVNMPNQDFIALASHAQMRTCGLDSNR